MTVDPAAAPEAAGPAHGGDRFSWPLLALMVIYTVGSTLVWYRARSIIPIGKTESVVVLYWLGLAVFLAGLWIFRGVAPWRLRRETLLLPVVALALLSVFWLYGRVSGYRMWIGETPPHGGLTGLLPYFFFVASSVLFRIALPLLSGRVLFGRRPVDYGYGVERAFERWWIYAGLVALVVPAVIWASSQPAFLRTYPWCRRAIADGTIGVWVFAVYAAAAFAFYSSGEAFWRGFILLGVARELRWNALAFMVMPYVLGHLGKPLSETLGAVAAGLVLGALALHHRSFWLGAVSHWVIAMTMDLAALWRKGITWVG